MAQERADLSRGAATERRISWLTLVLGFAACAVAGILRNAAWAAGLLIGTLFAWLNYRWLRRGLNALVSAATVQAGSEKPRVPLGTYFRMLFRYGLIALGVYVSFRYLKVPLLSMVLGLFALGAAAIAASVYEILSSAD